MSDHLPLYLTISSPKSDTNDVPQLIRDWKNFDKTLFRNELNKKLSTVLKKNPNLNGNRKFAQFTKITDSIVNKHLPLRPCTRKEVKRRQNPWMTNAIYKSIKTKNKLYFIQLKHRLLRNEIAYKKHRNILNHLIKKAKQKYYKNRLEKSANKSKAIWSVINEILNKKKKNKQKVLIE